MKIEKLTPEEWGKITPADLATHDKVKNNFICLYSQIHKVSESEAEGFYGKELRYWQDSLADENLKLASCTKLSLYNVFCEIATMGLSIRPGDKREAHIEKKGVNVGNKATPNWVNTAYFVIETYGELAIRLRNRQILYMSNPIVVYEGDFFEPATNDRGQIIVNYKPAIPRKSQKIICCYIRMDLPGGLFDFKWLDEQAIKRLEGYSTKANSRGLKDEEKPKAKPNALYLSGVDNQIDVGFLATKTIKHALKTLPRIKVGENVILADEEEEPQESFDNGEQITKPEAVNVEPPKEGEPF